MAEISKTQLPRTDNEKRMAREEFQTLLSDPWWRLNNLYYITNEDGEKVLFEPKRRRAQRVLWDNLWYYNIVPKARQLGVTTFFSILFLDQILFNANKTAGVIAHRQKDMKKIFRSKIQFAWKHMHPWIKDKIWTTKETSQTMEFNNGSKIFVDMSTRSGTVQYLHISEFGYICQKHPKKADEIVTGAFNSVHTGNMLSIESTARGSDGYFYDFCMQAKNDALQGKDLTREDFRIFFFPWYMDPKYSIDRDVTIDSETEKYFDKLEKQNNIQLTEGQKRWYVNKKKYQQHKMFEEFPSTLEEAFKSNIEGAYYDKWMNKAYEQGRIGLVPYDESLPVYTYWDLGMNDFTVILLVQSRAGEVRFIDMYWESGEGLKHYVDWLRDRSEERGYNYRRHYLPHDVKVQEMSGKTRYEQLQQMGLRPIQIGEKQGNIKDGIDQVRHLFSQFYIDEQNCQRLVTALESYRKQWDDRKGRYKDKPRHDEHSHFADAVRLLANEWHDQSFQNQTDALNDSEGTVSGSSYFD